MPGGALMAMLLSGVCLVSALCVACGRDRFRVILAFFVELAAMGAVLLSLGADYLAMVAFGLALTGTVLTASFSGMILVREAGAAPETSQRLGSRVLGAALGLGLGCALGWALLTLPAPSGGQESGVSAEMDVVALGKTLLGERLLVFEALAVMLLVEVIGVGLLMRKPRAKGSRDEGG